MPAPPRILVIEDDQSVRTVLSQGLQQQGYLVDVAGSAVAAKRAVEAGTAIDLITLDLNLADEDGLDLALEIRALRNVPIIIISGRAAPEDRVMGFEHGADDYIIKPFHIKEVAHRIQNVLARYTPSAAASRMPQEAYQLELGTLDISARTLKSRDGALITLTDAEFDLLAVLVRHAKRVLSRSQLMMLLHGREWAPQDRSLDVHIARLRRKIEPPGDAPQYIKSVRNVGYVLAIDAQRR